VTLDWVTGRATGLNLFQLSVKVHFFGKSGWRKNGQSPGSEADLGRFSMFGRTGVPTKKGPPQQDRQIFAT